jgi:hypothetical protein
MAFEFRVDGPVGLDDGVDELGQKRAVEAGLASEAAGAANDHAANVVASGVAGDDSVGDEESRGAGVVGHDPVGREQPLARRVVMPQQLLRLLDQRPQ